MEMEARSSAAATGATTASLGWRRSCRESLGGLGFNDTPLKKWARVNFDGEIVPLHKLESEA